MRTEHRYIEALMRWIMDHARAVLIIILALTALFAYLMKDLRIDADIFSFSAGIDAPAFVLTPENGPEEYLRLKKIGTVTVKPERGEVVEYEREGNVFDTEEFDNPVPYEEKAVSEYVFPEDRAEEEFLDGYVIVFTSDKMFTTEVLNTIYEVRDRLSERWEIGQCLSPFDYVTVEKKGTRLSLVPISPVKQGETWSEEDVATFHRRLMNDSIAKDYLYSSDGTTIMIYYRARGLNAESIAELDAIVKPLRQYGRVALNGGGLLTNAVYKYINSDLITLLVLCFAAILVVFYLSFRSLRSMLLPASLSVIGIIWTLGLMALCGYNLTIVTILTPCLVLTFGSSYSIHMLTEYFRAMRDDGNGQLERHYSHISRTILFAMITTVSGFLSQLVCRVEMFREFGITISFGVFICALLSVTYIPAVLTMTKAPDNGKLVRIKNGMLQRIIRKTAYAATRFWYVMLIILIVLTCFYFLIKDDMGFDSNYMKYFPSDDPIVLDTVYFAKTLGGTDPYYLTIRAPEGEENFFLKPENLKMIYAYESAVMAADPDLVQILSFSQYVSFLNEVYNGETGIPENAGLINYLSRTLRQIKSQIGSDVLNFLLSEDGSEITLSMRHYDWVEQDIQTNASARRIEQTLNYYRYMLPEGTTSQIWSGASSGLHASDIIIEDQNKATVISIVLIFICASLACSGAVSGIAALVPVLSAVMLNYVFMWSVGIPFDMITIGFSSVAIGTGVDDAIHFLLRLRARRKSDPDEEYTTAIRENIIETGRPIILTTLSVDIGLVMLVFASFNPIKYFGALMCLALTAAMISTLLILPAVLMLLDKIRRMFR